MRDRLNTTTHELQNKRPASTRAPSQKNNNTTQCEDVSVRVAVSRIPIRLSAADHGLRCECGSSIAHCRICAFLGLAFGCGVEGCTTPIPLSGGAGVVDAICRNSPNFSTIVSCLLLWAAHVFEWDICMATWQRSVSSICVCVLGLVWCLCLSPSVSRDTVAPDEVHRVTVTSCTCHRQNLAQQAIEPISQVTSDPVVSVDTIIRNGHIGTCSDRSDVGPDCNLRIRFVFMVRAQSVARPLSPTT